MLAHQEKEAVIQRKLTFGDTINRSAKKIMEALEVSESNPLQPGKMYLKLYHGRRTRDEEMEDWGFDGPAFGPLSSISITYQSGINVITEDGSDTGVMLDASDPLYFVDDLLHYEGAYYGDFAVITEEK